MTWYGSRQLVRRRGVLALRLIAACVAAMWTALSMAAPYSVSLVLSDDGEPYRQFEETFRANLTNALGRDVQLSSLRANQYAATSISTPQGADLIVTVGVRATETVLKNGTQSPVLSTLVPRQSFLQLRRNSGVSEGKLSAVYLDQPWARRLALVREALPGTRKVGALLGPESQGELRSLQSAAREAGMHLLTERIQESEQILPSLRRILSESDVLLVVPDGMVYNRNTVQSILLTSYRAQNPLFAYSPSYVTAGALAAVYSSPAQLAQQSAEVATKFMKSGVASLPAAQYAKYYSVSVNQQLARSMGITLAPEPVLLERLMNDEAHE